jgi:fluoride exporter
MTAQMARVEATRSDDGTPNWRTRLAPFAAISLGGVLGANARFLVGSLIGEASAPGFPWGTLFANVTGCFLIGLYLTLATERLRIRPTTRLFFVTGGLGSYTTFSIFSYESLALAQGGASILAVAYVVGSLLLGYLAVVAGVALARALYRAVGHWSVNRGTDA